MEAFTRTYNDGLTHKQRRRRRERQNRLSPVEWDFLCRLFGRVCPMCRMTDKLTRDHVKPLYDGGDSSIFNIQPLCATCNGLNVRKRYDFRTPEMMEEIHAFHRKWRTVLRKIEPEHYCRKLDPRRVRELRSSTLTRLLPDGPFNSPRFL